MPLCALQFKVCPWSVTEPHGKPARRASSLAAAAATTEAQVAFPHFVIWRRPDRCLLLPLLL